jgi:hypothetical protein
MEDPSKIGGAATSTVQSQKVDSAKSKYSPENIIVPRFCNHVLQIKIDSPHVSFAEFIDRDNLRWHCFSPLTCDHAIVIGGAMVSCRVRTAILNGQNQELRFK